MLSSLIQLESQQALMDEFLRRKPLSEQMQSPPPGFGAIPRLLAGVDQVASKGSDGANLRAVAEPVPVPVKTDGDKLQQAQRLDGSPQVQAAAVLEQVPMVDSRDKPRSRPPTPPSGTEQLGRGVRRILRNANEETRPVHVTARTARGPDGTRGFKYGRGKPLPASSKVQEGEPYVGAQATAGGSAAQVEKLQEELASATAEVERWKLETAEASSEIGRLQHELFAARFEADKLRNEAEERQVVKEDIKSEAEADREGARLQEDLSEAKSEIGRLQHELFEAKFETERLKSEWAEEEKVEWRRPQGVLASEEAERLQGELGRIREDLAQLKSELEERNHDAVCLRNELSDASLRVEQLQSDLAQRDMALQQSSEENAQLKIEVSKRQPQPLSSNEPRAETEDLQRKVAEAEAEIQRMRDQLYKAREEIGLRSRHVGIRRAHSGKQDEDGKGFSREGSLSGPAHKEGSFVEEGNNGDDPFQLDARSGSLSSHVEDDIENAATSVPQLGPGEPEDGAWKAVEGQTKVEPELGVDLQRTKELEMRVQEAEGVANLLMRELQEARNVAASYAQTIQGLHVQLAQQSGAHQGVQFQERGHWGLPPPPGALPSGVLPTGRPELGPMGPGQGMWAPHPELAGPGQGNGPPAGRRPEGQFYLPGHQERLHPQQPQQWTHAQHPLHSGMPSGAPQGPSSGPIMGVSSFPHSLQGAPSEMGPSAPPIPPGMQAHLPGASAGQPMPGKPAGVFPPGLLPKGEMGFPRLSPPPSPPFDSRAGPHAYAPSAPPVPMGQPLPPPHYGPAPSQHYGPSAPPHYLMNGSFAPGTNLARPPQAHPMAHSRSSQACAPPHPGPFLSHAQGQQIPSTRAPLSQLESLFQSRGLLQGGPPAGHSSQGGPIPQSASRPSPTVPVGLIPTSVLLSTAGKERGLVGYSSRQIPTSTGELESQDPAIVSLGVGFGGSRRDGLGQGSSSSGTRTQRQGIGSTDEGWVDEVIVFRGTSE